MLGGLNQRINRCNAAVVGALRSAGSFAAKLQASLVPERSVGSGTPTYTRNLAAYVPDFEGRQVLVPANAARFAGARVVKNLYANTAALATQGITTIAGQYTVSFTGTGTITFSGTYTGSLVGQGASTRVSATFTATAGTLTSTVSGSVTLAQAENVTGQSNQNPGPYVPVGAAPLPAASNYLWLPGSGTGNYASTVSAAANQIIADIDFKWVGSFANVASGAYETMLAKFASAGNQRAYVFRKDNANKLNVILYQNGTGPSFVSYTSDAAISTVATSGNKVGFRATVDVDNGAGNSDCTFYYSLDDGVTWVIFGNVQHSGSTTSIYASSAPVEIGSYDAGTVPLGGKTYWASLSNSIGGAATVYFDPTRFTSSYNGATMTAATGEVWTLNSTGAATINSGARITNDAAYAFGQWFNAGTSGIGGSGVDGLAVLGTLPANTVSSNIVTEATGAAISSSQAACAGGVTAGVVDANGPYGYLSEGARTNLALQTEDLTQAAWDATHGATPTANQYVARNGTTTMSKLTAVAGNTGHWIQNTANKTFTNTPATFSADLKYVNNRWAALYVTDGTNVFVASFDLLNGVKGSVSAGVTSTMTPTQLSGVYRCTLTATTVATVTGIYYVALHNIDSATALTWNAAGTEIIGAWAIQFEQAAFPSSYIPTTTTAVTRPAEIDAYPTASNITTNNFVVAGSTTFPTVPPAGNYYLWGSYVDANNSTSVYWDGTNLTANRRIGGTDHKATKALTPVAGTAFKWAARFSSATGTDIFVNGAVGTNDATTTACQIAATMQVGADGNGANQPYAETRNFQAWTRALADGQIAAL